MACSPHADAPFPADGVTVIGAGLAGSLAALALRRRGVAVELIAPPTPVRSPFHDPGDLQGDGPGFNAATVRSYGSVNGDAAIAQWRGLEASYGPLGLIASAVVCHGLSGMPGGDSRSPSASLLQPLRQLVPLRPIPQPFARLDGPTLAEALGHALHRATVLRVEQQVQAIEVLSDGSRLRLGDGQELQRLTVLLAAGAGCRRLWQALPPDLCTSWAGVLAIDSLQGSSRWLAAIRRGWMVFPRQLQRPLLERDGTSASGEPWVVDVGLAPWGSGLLAGQISWLPPQPGERPDAAVLEQRLRRELGRLDPHLADLPGQFHLVPVSYCRDGRALCGQQAPGLWVLAGASNAFSTLPQLAEMLAGQILAEPASPG